MSTPSKVIGGFLAGAIVGVSIELLLAPQKGSSTRQRLTKESKRISDDLANTIQHMLVNFKKLYNEKLEHFADGGRSSIDTLEKNVKA